MEILTRSAKPLSTSNLVRPEREAVMRYARAAYAGEPVVGLLERRLADFHDASHCIALCNGFWALVIALRTLALPGRSDVLMPSLTYRRMADVAAWAGLRPRFCEVDRSTLACSDKTMHAALTPEVGILLAVHPIVGCCDVPGLVHLAREKDIPLLFDSVESVFESVEAGKIGRFGNAECFSLHASKLLNGCEGGYITTDDALLADCLRNLRDGSFADGVALRLDPLHAAMALASFDELPLQIIRNKARFEAYRRGLAGLTGLRLVPFEDGLPTSYKNILVELTACWPLSRDETVRRLNYLNVLARAYYHPPLHAKSMAYSHVPAHLPVTDELSRGYLLLPCGHHVDLADIALVVDLLTELAR